jgi:hypothetical protein
VTVDALVVVAAAKPAMTVDLSFAEKQESERD